jgi:hypothetical protein
LYGLYIGFKLWREVEVLAKVTLGIRKEFGVAIAQFQEILDVLLLLVAELRGAHLAVEEVFVHRRFDVVSNDTSLFLSTGEEGFKGGLIVDRNVKRIRVERD